MSDWLRELEWNALAYAIVAGLALVGLVALWLFVPAVRRAWLPMPRLRPGAWSGLEVFLTLCIMQGFPVLIVGTLLSLRVFAALFGPEPTADAPIAELGMYQLRCYNVSSPLILTVCLGMILIALHARTLTRPQQFGLTWARWPANVALALVGFIVVVPLVLGLHVPLALVFPGRPHPLITLGKGTLEEWEWMFLAFQSVVAAPLLEEVVFRGVFQGWLRRATLQGHVTVCVATLFYGGSGLLFFLSAVVADTLGLGTMTTTPEWLDLTYPFVFSLALVAGYAFSLRKMARKFELSEMEMQAWYVQPAAGSLEATEHLTEEQARERRLKIRDEDEKRQRQWAEANANLAILGSAMFFAVAHSAAWPAPFALLFFGLVLGWLAKRTQSLVAPIALHALFNLVAFIALYGTVLSAPPANGNAETTAARPSVFGSTTNSVPGSQLPLRK